jgi:hypothetical protein
MLIGVPVAATPGLVPQEDVETVPAAAVELDAAELAPAGALEAAAALLLELELELELQAARTPSDSAAAAAAAARVRQDADLFMSSAFSWLTTLYLHPNGCVLRLSAAAVRLGLAEEDAVHLPQVNGASLHC